MADDLQSKIDKAKEELKKAWKVAAAAVEKKTQDSSGDVAAAAEAATEAVAEAMKKLEALKQAHQQQLGISGGRRKHKARGTKRRRHGGGFMEYLPESLKNLFGVSPTAAPVAAPPVAAPPPGASASFGGKSGKKRKHSRRKY